jgi:hypothetical protein
MPVTLPPVYGKADWTDYVDYWRDADVTWIQDRTIIRYADVATRNTALAGATAGQVSYVQSPDRLEFYSGSSRWIGVLGAQNLKASPVNNTNADESVTLSQTASTGGAGLVLGKNLTSVSTDTDLNGVLKVTGTGASGFMSLKTGATTVKFTTSATDLVIDKPVTVQDLISITNITATVSIAGASCSAGSYTGGSMNLSGTINGGTITGTTGTIGGVNFASNVATAPVFQSDHARFYGNATSALVRYWDGSAFGNSYLEVGSTFVRALATDFMVKAQPKFLDSKGIIYYDGTSFGTPGTILGYGGPVVYSTVAISASNYPPGTIWIF